MTRESMKKERWLYYLAITQTAVQDGVYTVTGEINFIREFLFTYTWGTESYSYEVQEQFGYFTLREYKEFFQKELGAVIIQAVEFFEEGYYDNLHKTVGLEKEKYPASNCILVVEKRA